MEKDEYIEKFDKIFKTKTLPNFSKENLSVLFKIFEKFADEIYKPTKHINNLIIENNKVLDKLLKILTYEQKEILESYLELVNEFSAEQEKQVFIFGFILANEINNETKIK
jgi:hypothetical protein